MRMRLLTTAALSAALLGSACRKAEPPVSEGAPPAAPAPGAPPVEAALLEPEKAAAQAPAAFKARLTTTKGDIVISVRRDWSPHGADRFYNLLKVGYLKDVAFFRAVKGFMVQFGIHGDPRVSERWRASPIPDDPPKGVSNARGFVTYATAGPNTRTTQLFINLGNNAGLDSQGFTPFGEVVEGMAAVDALYDGYGDGPPYGRNGPEQGRVQYEGNEYLKGFFPKLDYIRSARLE